MIIQKTKSGSSSLESWPSSEENENGQSPSLEERSQKVASVSLSNDESSRIRVDSLELLREKWKPRGANQDLEPSLGHFAPHDLNLFFSRVQSLPSGDEKDKHLICEKSHFYVCEKKTHSIITVQYLFDTPGYPGCTDR